MDNGVCYRVGDLVIDPGRGRITRGEQDLSLPKLSFDLLLALTRAAPNLLSIDELMEQVWPGLVVTPETVSQRVKLLRDALGDDAKTPRYIGGLRGRGYQIIAPVDVVPIARRPAPTSDAASTGPQQPASGSAAPSSMAWQRRFGIQRLAIIAAVALPFGLGLYLLASHNDGKASARLDAQRAVRVSNSGQGVAEAAPFTPPPRSVAVLSFVNLSGDPRDEYFADGLAEELVHSLTRITQLRVAARTSSFSFKGTAVAIPTVGRKLNVGNVLEGSVRKDGPRVRVTAQLINTRDGYQLWSQTYDRDLKNVLAVQTEIASAVADTLRVTLLGNDKEKLGVGGTANPLAFDAYLRGRHGESIQDETGLRGALAALDEAIALDPHYANALAFRADVLAQIANEWARDPKERERLSRDARTSAEKAVAMAPNSGLAHAELGNVLTVTSADYARIDAEYRRSIELEPGNAELLRDYASYAALFGRPDALAAARRAVALDPLSLGAHANLGVTLYYARRHDEARAAFKEATALGTNRLTINWAGFNELAAGRPSAALPYCEGDSEFWYDQVCLAMAYHRLNRRKEAAAIFAKMLKEQGEGAAYQYAQIHAYWGEPREALKWLAKAVELQDGGLLAIKTDPFLDPLRNEPQFKEIVAKLDLPS